MKAALGGSKATAWAITAVTWIGAHGRLLGLVLVLGGRLLGGASDASANHEGIPSGPSSTAQMLNRTMSNVNQCAKGDMKVCEQMRRSGEAKTQMLQGLTVGDQIRNSVRSSERKLQERNDVSRWRMDTWRTACIDAPYWAKRCY